MDNKNLTEFIRALPLFAVFADEDLALLTKDAQLRSLRPGEIVFNQGDPGDSFYIVYSGKIRIIQRKEQGTEVSLGVSTRGDHFGETALITESPRNAAARAAEDSVLIVIPGKSFHEHLFSKPALRDYFDRFIRCTSINRFIRTCTNLSALSSRDLQQLLGKFRAEFFKAGDVVFRQGAEADRFFLIESGTVKVAIWENRQQVLVNFLREGDFFGEKALLEDSTRTADIICLTDCHFFSLTKEDFSLLVAQSPRLKTVIQDRISSYFISSPPLPRQEKLKQELAAFKKIDVEEGPPPQKTAPTEEIKPTPSRFRRRFSFPFIRQHDQSTCGTTCIMMIARHYGKQFAANRLRELAHVDSSGATLANLASAAEQLGFSARGMRLTYEDLLSTKLPCIAHWQGYHYVVIYRITGQQVWIADPARGLRKYSRSEFADNWNGITLVLEPQAAFAGQKEDTSSLSRFVSFVSPYKMILLEIFLASLLLNIFGLATPLFTQNVIDRVLVHQNTSMLNIMLIGMLIVLIFRIATMIVRQYLIIHTSMKIDLSMLVLFYKHILALPLGYFKVRKIGDFITRFGENMKIRNFLTNTALTIVLDAFLIVVYICLMFYYNVQMTIIVLLFIPIFIGITLLFTPLLKRLNIDSFSARAESEAHLIESINGIDTIKAMNVEHPVRWKWEDKFIKSLNIDFRLYNTGMYFHSIGDLVATLSSTIILWYGAREVIQGAVSIGELMAFMALVGSVTTPINRIVMVWDDIQETLVSVDRINDVFAATPEFPSSEDQSPGLIIREAKGKITFEKLFFRYGGADDPYILSNINLTVEPGQTVAIVGRSGSGKTTLVRLLARFYDATEGRIKVDGIDIKNLHLSHLRRLVGFVLQENFLFSGSIRENIALGDSEASMEKIIEAAKLANAHDFISGLPLGYETQVGESGLQLSGGQKQRIAIARVLYANPTIIIFDEATSSLDSESEQAIQKNLQAILQDRTALIIAHRLSTVRSADMIVVLDNGEIVEQGTHEALMAQQGLYHYLNHQQLNL